MRRNSAFYLIWKLNVMEAKSNNQKWKLFPNRLIKNSEEQKVTIQKMLMNDFHYKINNLKKQVPTLMST